MNKTKNLEKGKPQHSEGEHHLKKGQEKLKTIHEELAVFIGELNELHGVHRAANQLNSTDRFTQEKMDHLQEQMDAIIKKIESKELTYQDMKKDRDLLHRDFKVVEEGAHIAFQLCRLRRVEIPKSLEKKLEEFHVKIADLKHL